MKFRLHSITREQREIIISTVQFLSTLYPEVNVRFVGEAILDKERLYAKAGKWRRAIYFDPSAIVSLSNEKLRWITTHEFGHLLLNEAEATGFVFDGDSYYGSDLMSISSFAQSHWDRPCEVFAECFAYSVLKSEPSWAHGTVTETYNYIKEMCS